MIAVLAWLAPLPATADFTEGLAAYDGGDYATALAEWRPLTRNGDAEAQIALADLYMQGYGVPRNPAMAVRWYHLAAGQGAVMAQVNLGDLYARGLDVGKNLITAHAWLYLAAESGHTWARKRLTTLEQQLTPIQINIAAPWPGN